MNRYRVEGAEGEFQASSEDRVLANKLNITSPDEMAEVELRLLEKLYESVLTDSFPDRALRVNDLKAWHRRWLGNVYPWAGQERSVNLAKGGFPFAAAAQIPKLLEKFERDCLARYTPCSEMDEDILVTAIAVTHVEFILIHPFREGNGRLSRLLADVMTVQADHSPLDYSAWDADKDGYFSAIQAGMTGNYGPMRDLVTMALRCE